MGWKPFKIKKPQDVLAPGVGQAVSGYQEKKEAQAAEAAQEAAKVTPPAKKEKRRIWMGLSPEIAEKRKTAARLKTRGGGRNSTILTTSDKLGG